MAKLLLSNEEQEAARVAWATRGDQLKLNNFRCE
jgi:hypothetical protein